MVSLGSKVLAIDSLNSVFCTLIGLGSNVTIIIQANDGVAGQVGFDEQSSSVVVQEGNQVSLSVNRTLSVGRVSVDWQVTGTNASSDFVVVNGTVEFSEVGYIAFSLGLSRLVSGKGAMMGPLAILNSKLLV